MSAAADGGVAHQDGSRLGAQRASGVRARLLGGIPRGLLNATSRESDGDWCPTATAEAANAAPKCSDQYPGTWPPGNFFGTAFVILLAVGLRT